MQNTWYVIINPTSGEGKASKKINNLKKLFIKYNIEVEITTTKFKHHENILVQKAIKKGFLNIVSVGGDGTLHHIVNGIMSQSFINPSKIKIAVIPIGTGNDWVKTYYIPTDMELAIQLINQDKYIYQDIGEIKLIKSNQLFYFNNVAGIGFDGFVVNKINKLKRLGAISYLIGGLIAFLNFKQSRLFIYIKNIRFDAKIFMINIGLCKYSGGGLQLTDYVNHKNGFFDITLVENIKLPKVLLNIRKLFNGNLRKLKEVTFYKDSLIKIEVNDTHIPYIQSDGEIIGKGNTEIRIIKNAIKFIIK